MEAFLVFTQLLFKLSILVSIVYCWLIYRIHSSWQNIPIWSIPNDYTPSTSITIIVAARNEDQQIELCIKSIIDNHYPKQLLQIIVVDDHSVDDTYKIVQKIHSPCLLLLEAVGHGKKNAISEAMQHATGELIICTDADCQVPQNWLFSLTSYYQKNDPHVIAAPIKYASDNSLVQQFQKIDAYNNMCVTAAGIEQNRYFLANGANIAYKKTLFEQIGGFSRNLKHVSGDDVFLIQEAAKIDPAKVRFLKSKEAIVNTQPEHSWTDLWRQRKRWATKTSSYASPTIMTIQGFVFFFTLLIVTNAICSLLGFFSNAICLLIILSVKWLTDYRYLSSLSQYFSNKKTIKTFLPVSIVFIGYILFAGYSALYPTPITWKGRKGLN